MAAIEKCPLKREGKDEKQRQLGQFYTKGNPFHFNAFKSWRALFEADNPRVIEPFAGANRLVRLAKEAGWEPQWECWDVDPPAARAEGVTINKRDTLANFPAGCRVAVTNPPYLAKNSATRRGLAFPSTKHDDLYKLALEKMLEHCEYVAAIVPETFLTSGLFTQRLRAVVSITDRLFEQTEHPVCLALFVPASTDKGNDFEVWSGQNFVGLHSALRSRLPGATSAHRWVFNESAGAVGLRAIDGTLGPSIAFVMGSDIPSHRIKKTGRSITRISGCPAGLERRVIEEANRRLRTFRRETSDSLLAAFKGLRKDGRYRRRIDFNQARRILDLALEECAGRAR